MVEIYLLEQLDALARKGTLVAAAEELHLTQPTLSRSMRRLEEEFGVPLFERSNKKIKLNENGLLAADYAARILTLEREMEQRIRLLEQSRHTLSFGAVSPGPIKELVPQLTDFAANMVVSAEVKKENELIDGLREGRYQLIALNRSVDMDDFFCMKVCSERLYYCFKPVDHPVSKDGIYFKDINGRSILMPVEVGFWNDVIERYLPDSKIIVQEGNESVNIIAENSTLPAFSSDIAMRHNVVRPARVAIPILDEEATADYYCVCRKSDKRIKKIIAVISQELTPNRIGTMQR